MTFNNNKVHKIQFFTIFLCAFIASAAITTANTTNAIPHADSFEMYSNGLDVDGTNGWYAGTNNYATVTNIGSYTFLPTSLPLPAPGTTHTNVLFLDSDQNSELTNLLQQTVLTNVWVDTMIKLTPCDMDRILEMTNDPTVQVGIALRTNGQLWVAHATNWVSPVTKLTELENDPMTGDWARVTITMDYASNQDYLDRKAFKLQINGHNITNQYAYTDPSNPTGGSTNGVWFLCYNQNNDYISSVTMSGQAWVDDFVVTNGQVLFGAGSFIITASIVPGSYGGTISPSGEILLADGASTNFTITPSNHWYILQVYTNGIGIGPTNNYEEPSASASYSLVAEVAPYRAAYGVPHWWLARYNLPTNDYGATNDWDVDTIPTWQEWAASVHPSNANSTFSIVEFGRESGTNYLKWVSEGIDPMLPPFEIEVSTNILGTPVWSSVYTSEVDRVDGTNVWYDPAGSTDTSANYRLIAPTNSN